MANPETLPFSGRDTRRRDALAGRTLIPAGKVELDAELTLPEGARGLVLFAHGSGSRHDNPRAQHVARALRQRGIGTLLFDALTPSERRRDALDERLRFDIGLHARRLVQVTAWAQSQPFGKLPVGYFGAGTGVAAAIVAAAERPDQVRAVVCRGGKPGLAGSALLRRRGATLLLVGSEDPMILEQNELAQSRMPGIVRLEVVAGAGHLFEESGVPEIVAARACDWFMEHLSFSGLAGS